MPGQRRRKRKQEDDRRRATDRFAPEAGRWEGVFETRDESEWRTHLQRLRAEHGGIDRTATRLDIFCGRLINPTTYRLSVFVPAPGEFVPAAGGPDSVVPAAGAPDTVATGADVPR